MIACTKRTLAGEGPGSPAPGCALSRLARLAARTERGRCPDGADISARAKEGGHCTRLAEKLAMLNDLLPLKTSDQYSETQDLNCCTLDNYIAS